MRIFQNHPFAQFARKNRIPLAAICKAARELSSGLIHANLGGGVYKQRIARPGEGKSGGFRTIVAFQAGRFTCFLYGFAKKDFVNVDRRDLADLHLLATKLLRLSEVELDIVVKDGNLIEVKCDDKTLP